MIYRLFLFLVLLFLTGTLLTGAYLFTHRYEDTALLLYTHVRHWLSYERFVQEIFPRDVFERSKTILVILLGVCCSLLLISYAARNSLQQLFSFILLCLKKTGQQWQQLFRYTWFTVFILLVTFLKLILLYLSPFHVDEYASFVLYISKGPLVILSNYDVPNNHVLYNLIAWCFKFVCSPFWSMKLPALLASLLTSIMLFWYARKYLPLGHVWLLVILLNVMSAFVVYGLIGRGHIFAILFFSGAGISYMEFFRDKRFFVFIAVFTALGIASVPYFMLPAIVSGCTALFYMYQRKRMELLPYLVAAAFLSVVMVFIFYSPAIAFKGVQSLYRHSWAQSVPFREYLYTYPLFIQDVTDTIISLEPVSVYVFLFIQVLFFVLSKNEPWRVLRSLMVFSSLVTVILTLMYHTPLFPRIWLFTLPVLAFQLGYIFYRIYSLSRPWFWLTFSLVCGYSLYATGEALAGLNSYYVPMAAMVERSLHEPEDSLYIADDTYYMYAKFLILDESLPKHIVYAPAGGTLSIVAADGAESGEVLICNPYMMLVRRKQ